jgi:serine/threonine-protein kinase
MADELLSRLATAVGSRYEIADEIGRGGMGVVFRGKDVRLRRSVAIKLLPPELAFREEVRSRFLREAQTAAQLSHPNVVPIYSVDEVDGLVFFVMALVEGDSLGAYLKREGRAPLEFARRVLRDVADALAYAHTRSIIHRDIKPDNVLIDRVTGRTLVTDFGIARAAEGDSRLTATGIAVGTPAYMSPEQAIGERDIDGRSDLYSLGVVGYHMLTGELPFTANNTPSMLMKHINQAPRPIRDLRPDIPVGLERGIERAMAKQPDQRWADANAFRDALADDAPRAPMVSVAPAPPRQAADPSVGVAPWQQPQPPSMHRAVRDVVPQNNHAPAPPVAPKPQLPSWMPPQPAAPPSQPAIPQWMPTNWHEARKQWRQYDKEQKRLFREQFREARRQRGRGLMAAELPPGQETPVEYRIRSFRMQVARVGTTAAILAGINFVTSPAVPWFLIPAGFMSLSLLRRGGSLWADGIRWKDIFGKDARLPATTGHGSPQMPALGGPPRNMAPQRAAALVPADVHQGPHGGHVLRAAEDEQSILEAMGKLSTTDREMIPDVKPTVESLVERVAALAQGLHRLDHDVTIEALQRLDERIATALSEPEGSEREKKLTLLRRQRETLGDLRGRRDSLATQLESASLMLQNIRIDLIALRAAGVQSSIDDASSATQEARALSRDIGHVLEAAKQVRE